MIITKIIKIKRKNKSTLKSVRISYCRFIHFGTFQASIS